jgi:hypothetical protein
MKAVKANRVYTITEAEQKRFISEGYDIYDDHGNCIAYGAGKTVPYGKFKKVVDQLAVAEAEIEELRKQLAKSETKSTSKSKSKK